MCGIAGFAGFDDARLLRAMSACLLHRGPDDTGYFEAPGVGLTMRRLAVIDLKAGHQPMSNEDGTIWLVFNGEIYNYQELTAQLKARGHVFASTSDTETIVHLYEDFGLDFVHHLRGMFAVAIWDGPRKRLVLARDRIGEKPLFFAREGGKLLFGSEPKTILQHPLARDVDARAVCEFLAAGYVPAPRTFYANMENLAPGHLLVHEGGRATVRPYWRLETGAKRSVPVAAAEGELAEMLADTVDLCLKSDVEVGAFLSGGIDSSVLVALMSKKVPSLQTFTVGYRGLAAGFNELEHAARVAKLFGTQHHELVLDARSSADLLPRILWHYDEPHGEPTSVLVYLLCQFARERVKVAVGGTGSDEIFFGYPKHGAVRMLSYYLMVPRLVRERVVEKVVSRWPESTRGSRFAKRAKRFVRGSSDAPAEAYLSWTSLLHRDVRARLVAESVRERSEDPEGEAFLRDYLAGPGGGDDLLHRVAALDIGAYLPEFQLRYMDRMSMAHGLEVRAPFCDYKLVEYVTSLPARHRLRRTTSKYLLKRASRRWMPEAIARRKKVGFDSPIGEWFKGELREFLTSFLSRENIERSGLLRPDGVAQLLEDHLAGRSDYSLQL
ncbi:MAG TPA: asparagine synthase (glutamine-hydrolyzing), partial [Planctomycetota bacterium]|nr:asparagine synthase (glutamine-hydrolyzing) [Planctomycetota bacterium]